MPETANLSVSKSRNDVLYRRTTRHYDTTGQFYFLRRGQPIDVMRYLPKFLKDEPEFLKIQDALSKEHEKLKAKAMDIVRQFYIETATWGLRSWERIFEITPIPGSDYEARRAAVKAKMAGWGVMTVEQSTRLMNQFVIGKDGYINELPEPGVLELVIPSSTDYHRAMWKALDEMLPAHLAFYFLYTVYGDLVGDEAVNLEDDGEGDFDAWLSLSGFHDLIPYGTNISIFSRDGILRHGGKACRNGHFVHGGRGFHGIQGEAYAHRVGKRNLETERHFFAMGYGFEETVETKDSGHMALSMPLLSEDVPKTKEGDAGLEVFMYLRHDGSIRHDGKYARGVPLHASGKSFELVRESRNGKLCRGGGIAHRESPLQWPV